MKSPSLVSIPVAVLGALLSTAAGAGTVTAVLKSQMEDTRADVAKLKDEQQDTRERLIRIETTLVQIERNTRGGR